MQSKIELLTLLQCIKLAIQSLGYAVNSKRETFILSGRKVSVILASLVLFTCILKSVLRIQDAKAVMALDEV